MPAPASSNRTMYWRIVRRLLTDNPGRVAVMLLALGAGAAVTAALLNLQVDARRRLTSEFRAFGPNIIVAPPDSRGTIRSQGATLDESTLRQIPTEWNHQRVDVAAFLYLVASISAPQSSKSFSCVVAGSKPFAFLRVSARLGTPPVRTADTAISIQESACVAGTRLAQQFGVQQNAELVIVSGKERTSCQVMGFKQTGGPEDDQITLPLRVAQRLAALPNRLSIVELRMPGTPQEITNYISALQKTLPDVEVRPIRQFTEGEAKIYNRISGVLTATIAVVLVLTALCVMAAMTNVAMERRNDVGLMKAIGGATRRVLRLFLMEAALLGLTSGLLGAAIGIVLSMWLGKAVFGLAARPRLIVYPVAVALTVIVAIAGAFPLRRLANIRPASVFRGEA